jgi:Putative Flp pilus-assembly TadE/G-like
MVHGRLRGRDQKGQMLVLFALASTVIILLVGLVIDGGNALAKQRASQNAADFAALGGARIVAEWIGGDTFNGTDDNVKAAIIANLNVNGGAPITTWGVAGAPYYVNASGVSIGYVGNASNLIPANTVGVSVSSSRSWTPYFLGIIGVNSWTASANAVARGGYYAGPPLPGSLFPAGISTSFFNTYPTCSGDVNYTDPTSDCYPQQLTPGNLNVPGGFGWLKFGCSGYGLGQGSNGGCDNNKPFLQTEIGHPGGASTPLSNSFGCCTKVGLPGSSDLIGSLPGNKASANCSWYINNGVTVTIPIWDYATGNGSGASYHIVGFAGFQITACRGAKDIAGVIRQQFFLGPTTSDPGTPGLPQTLAVQLVH